MLNSTAGLKKSFPKFYTIFCDLTGYVISLLLRLLGGEYYLKFYPAMIWPWYDEASNLQQFPFRTICMFLGLSANLLVSYLFKWLFESGKLNSKYDVFNAVVNPRNTRSRYTTSQEADRHMDRLDYDVTVKKGAINKGANVDDAL